LAARNGGRLGLVALAGILLLGLGLRVDYAWEGREPVFDAEAYARIAANLDRGEGFTAGAEATQPSSNYSPGLPLLVAGLYRVTGGEDERLARVVLALIGSLAILLTYLIGRRLGGPLAGILGAAVVAIYPALLEYGGMLMGEPLATTLLAGALLALLRAADPGRAPAWWLLPGALFGALALTRPEYLGVALLLALMVLILGMRGDGRRALAHAALMLAGLAVVVAPWTIRNAVALDRFVPISTGGGQVLFAGTYLPSGGDPERVGREVLERHPGLTRRLPPQPRLEQILAALAGQRHPGMEADRALARMGRERLWDDITGRPLEYGEFLAAKAWRVWGHGPRQVMQRPGWELFHWLVVALALAGLVVLAARRRREALPIAIVLLAVTAICLLLVASPRRTLVLLPVVAALAGVGVSAARASVHLWLSAPRAKRDP
jgi:4-amino-4-deoxy-L-arabinose transferase-like glycosyltransferase